MTDHNLAALDAELCRIPGVVSTRFVRADPANLSVTIFVLAGTDVARVLREVAVVAGVHFRLTLEPDRVIIMEVGLPTVVWPLKVPVGQPRVPPLPAAESTAAESTAAPDTRREPAPSAPAAARAPRTPDVDAEEALASAQRTVAAMLEQLGSATTKR